MEIHDVFQEFRTSGTYAGHTSFGDGNIHETYLVSNDAGGKFILQKLNKVVFKDLDVLIRNQLKITSHLREAVKREDLHWEIPSPIPAKNDDYLVREKGNAWRLTPYIEHTPEIEDSLPLYLKAGISYGHFIRLMSDFPVKEIQATIPDFHNLEYRLDRFKQALSSANESRKIECEQEIQTILDLEEEMLIIPRTINQGGVPIRITHNDSKIDNILFNEKEVPVSLVDLDTVMPGIVHFDFGDSIRSFTNPAKEDETEVSRIDFRIEVFESFSWGFLSALRNMLTQKEKETLVYAPSLFAYMQAVRFLTDYLQGDVYYRTEYPEHNLNRAVNQLVLLEKMRSSFREMQRIINEFNY
jgi:hypothetical protein